jgi:hypothetical protein
MVELWGGGGGGGSKGGGAGGYGKQIISVIAGTSYPIIVGSPGVGGWNWSSATSGGNSSFNGTIVATGGSAGGNQNNGVYSLGGSCNATFNISAPNNYSTSGGDAPCGGKGGIGGCSPLNGIAPGAGGGAYGGSCWPSDGAPGRLIIWF